MDRVTGLDIESDRIVGQQGGFLAIRRVGLRNRRGDGSRSEPYLCDFLVRPFGLDAVVVVLYARRGGGGVDVLLRQCLRPALALGRASSPVPVPDEKSYLYLTELVAGIIEERDRGRDGIRRRAAEEAFEEAGYRIEPDAVSFLGQPMFPTPGTMAEKFWLVAAEVPDPAAQERPPGDGSPMEEGASTRWMDLDEAIRACVRGDIEDCKTELALRRLRDVLG